MWYTVTWVLVPLGSVLLCASLVWNGPLRRGLEGKRWWEGSEGSLRGILVSHLGPSLSHLYQCGGCKAPEQVGKLQVLKIPALRQELWPAVSLKPSLLLNEITLDVYIHAASCHVCQVMSSVCTLREKMLFFTASCRLQHLRKIRMISQQRRCSQTLCAHAGFKTGRGSVVKSKVCYSNRTPQEPLNRYLCCFL